MDFHVARYRFLSLTIRPDIVATTMSEEIPPMVTEASFEDSSLHQNTRMRVRRQGLSEGPGGSCPCETRATSDQEVAAANRCLAE